MKKKRTKPTVSRHDVETACDIFLSRLAKMTGEPPPRKDEDTEGWQICQRAMRATLEHFAARAGKP